MKTTAQRLLMADPPTCEIVTTCNLSVDTPCHHYLTQHHNDCPAYTDLDKIPVHLDLFQNTDPCK
jgi:hypothetical protein